MTKKFMITTLAAVLAGVLLGWLMLSETQTHQNPENTVQACRVYEEFSK